VGEGGGAAGKCIQPNPPNSRFSREIVLVPVIQICFELAFPDPPPPPPGGRRGGGGGGGRKGPPTPFWRELNSRKLVMFRSCELGFASKPCIWWIRLDAFGWMHFGSMHLGWMHLGWMHFPANHRPPPPVATWQGGGGVRES